MRSRSGSRRGRVVGALAACVILGACAGGPEPGPDAAGTAPATSALVPSPGLARAIAASLEPGSGGVMPDGPVRRCVADAAGELARAAGVTLGSVAVLDDGGVVARALPGGHLQVSRGLLVRCARHGSRGSIACAGVLALLVGEVAEGAPEARLADALRGEGIASLPSSVAPLIAGQAGLRDAARAVGKAVRAANAGRQESAESAVFVGPPTQSPLDRSIQARAASALEAQGVALGVALDAIADVLGEDAAVLGPCAWPEARPAGHEGARTMTADGSALVRDLDLGSLPADEAREARLDAAAALLRSDDRAVLAQALGFADGPGVHAAVVRAHAQLAGGQAREAERTLRTALVLDPGAHEARLALARLYLGEDRRDAARTEAQAAVERAPLAADAHLVLGLAEDDPDRARARLTIAAGLDPDGPVGRRAALALGALARRASPPSPPPPDPDRHRPLGGNR